jgi:NAD+ kinase
MSAGGAIIDPKIECISMLPLSPYLSINSSPIIFSKDTKLEFVYRCVRHNSAYIALDGGESIKLSDGDRVIITESPYTTKLLRFKKTDFYRLLNTKLANRISELAQRA